MMSAERHRTPEAQAHSPDGAPVQEGHPERSAGTGSPPTGDGAADAAAHEGGHLSAVGGARGRREPKSSTSPTVPRFARRPAAVGRVGRSGATDRTSRFATPLESRRRGSHDGGVTGPPPTERPVLGRDAEPCGTTTHNPPEVDGRSRVLQGEGISRGVAKATDSETTREIGGKSKTACAIRIAQAGRGLLHKQKPRSRPQPDPTSPFTQRVVSLAGDVATAARIGWLRTEATIQTRSGSVEFATRSEPHRNAGGGGEWRSAG